MVGSMILLYGYLKTVLRGRRHVDSLQGIHHVHLLTDSGIKGRPHLLTDWGIDAGTISNNHFIHVSLVGLCCSQSLARTESWNHMQFLWSPELAFYFARPAIELEANAWPVIYFLGVSWWSQETISSRGSPINLITGFILILVWQRSIEDLDWM